MKTYLDDTAPGVIEKGGTEDKGGNLYFVQRLHAEIRRRRQAEEEAGRLDEELRKIMCDLIDVVIRILETRDPYTAQHQRRVAELAGDIARAMELSEKERTSVIMAALIHDLGKIYIPSEILSKPGRLNPYEFSLIKTHSQVGYDIIKNIDFPWPVSTIILQHHELLDGTGYPSGLSGEQIMIESRVLTVADVVEAMSSNRPYRAALGTDMARKEITEGRGVRFDSDVVDACLDIIDGEKFTLWSKI